MITLTKHDKSKAGEFDGQKPDYEARLDYYDPSNNNNKFWHIQVFGRFIVRNFGRHGTDGQTQVHSAWNEWGAESAAIELRAKKQKKGYVKDQTTVLDHIARKMDENG